MSSAALGSQEWRWAPSTDELLTTRMGMCHLAASEHQLSRSWGALCLSQPAQCLGMLLRVGQGALTSSPPGVVWQASPAILSTAHKSHCCFV